MHKHWINFTKNFMEKETEMVDKSIVYSINLLAKKCYEISKSKGFWDIDTEKEKLLHEQVKNKLKSFCSSYEESFYDGEANSFIDEAKEYGLLKNERNFGEFASLVHTEISEAVEAKRHGDPKDHHCPEFKNSLIELADCCIRIFDFCGANNLPLGEAIIAKLKYNSERPFLHGKKF